jgi:ankyrin repeat protein
MKRLLILTLLAVSFNQLFSQNLIKEIVNSLSSNSLIEKLNMAQADINNLSKYLNDSKTFYYNKTEFENVNELEKVSLGQYKQVLENELMKRFNLKNGETPYHFIAKTGATEYFNLNPVYLSSKYSINQKSDWEETPVHVAINKNSKNPLETIKLLRHHNADILIRNKYQATCLHLASQKNNAELAKYFVNEGIEVNDTTDYGQTALHYAAKNNNKEMVDFLLENGANTDEKAFYTGAGFAEYSTIIHSAVLNDWLDVLDKCIKEGINVNCKVSKSRYKKDATPLLYAVESNKLKAAQYLIEHGADVNAFELWTGYTPLVTAIRNGNTELFDLLMKNGANVSIPTPTLNGFPIYHCFHTENEKAGHHFAKAIITNNSYFPPNTKEGSVIFDEMYKKLYLERVKAKSTSLFEKDVPDLTPLHECARLGWTDLCEILIDKGADVNAKSSKAYSPIQKAVQNKKYVTAKLLIQKGADPNLKNSSGQNAFDIAKEMSDKKMKLILKGK